MPMDESMLNQSARIPAAWECVIDHCDHSELACVNALASKSGIDNPPIQLGRRLGAGHWRAILFRTFEVAGC